MKLAIIIFLAVIAMWVAFIFLGQIFYWLGLAGICVIVVILLKFILGSYIDKKRESKSE
jgi:hypothetical protein